MRASLVWTREIVPAGGLKGPNGKTGKINFELCRNHIFEQKDKKQNTYVLWTPINHQSKPTRAHVLTVASHKKNVLLRPDTEYE